MQNLTTPLPKSHIYEIDGLRGIAILLVVILHWIILPLSPLISTQEVRNILSLFAYGVDLFFIISGFLIGTILLNAPKKPLSIIVFYARRLLRIWPLYYLLLGLVYLLLGGQGMFVEIPRWSFFLFVFNFWESNGLSMHPSLGTLWSLAIEEQFYAIAPLMFFFLGRKQLAQLAVLCIILSPFLRLGIILNTNLNIWKFTPARLDGISMGVLLSILLSFPGTVSFLLTKIKILKATVFLLLVASIFCKIVLPSNFWFSFGTSLMVLLFGFLLVMVLMLRLSNQNNRILNSIILRYLGLRCYNIYLFHIIFMLITNAFVNNFFIRLAIQVILTLGFAHISWKYIEFPQIKLGKKFSY